MTLDEVLFEAKRGNYPYPPGNVGDVLNNIYEVYHSLLGLLISKIPSKLSSEAVEELREKYGVFLENYPRVSGRLQLLYLVLFGS